MRTFLFALGLATVVYSAPRVRPLDSATLKKMEAFGTRWWKARPKNKFFKWDPAVREALLSEARGFGRLPEGSWRKARAAFAKSLKRHGPKGKQLSKGKIWLDNPYGKPYGKKMWFYVTAARGRNKGLIVGLHGGGKGAGSADGPRGIWRMKGCLGMYPQGLVLQGDNWNTVQGEKQILSLIEIAKAQYDIDPDRVYVTGFSMGGTGSWHMAGRFPDLFAGAAPCAGVLMASPISQVPTREQVSAVQYGIVPNVRNLAMYYFIGLSDDHCMPGTYLFVKEMLADLRKEDPTGYSKIRFATYPGLGHAFPPGEPAKCIAWLSEQRRDTFPEKIVWEYARFPHPLPLPEDRTGRIAIRWMYWIHHKHPADRMEIDAKRKGNTFDIEIMGADPEDCYLMLNPEMIDVTKEVVVRIDGEEFYRGKPVPDFATVVESFDAKLDRRLFFDRKVPLWKP